jgi:hypothetical protein
MAGSVSAEAELRMCSHARPGATSKAAFLRDEIRPHGRASLIEAGVAPSPYLATLDAGNVRLSWADWRRGEIRFEAPVSAGLEEATGACLIEWTYSALVFHRSTVEALADRLKWEAGSGAEEVTGGKGGRPPANDDDLVDAAIAGQVDGRTPASLLNKLVDAAMERQKAEGKGTTEANTRRRLQGKVSKRRKGMAK